MGGKTIRGSYLRANFNRLKVFAKGIVDAFSVSRRYVRIAFISAWTQTRIVFNFNMRNKGTMKRSIQRLRQIRGNLNLAKAIRVARRNIFARFFRKDTPNVLVVITAGKSGGRLRRSSTSAKRVGITIITVGILPMVDQTDLTIMSSPPCGGNRMTINFIGLMNILTIVVNKIIKGMLRVNIILMKISNHKDLLPSLSLHNFFVSFWSHAMVQHRFRYGTTERQQLQIIPH